MNSAAKLRNRGIAIAGATAIVMTSFGPAAFAWDTTTTALGAANTAGTASIGVIDADRALAGTQGAQLVSAGANDQLTGEVRFVLPSKWSAGDTLEFRVGLPTVTNSDARISWAGQPAVNIDPTPFDASTQVEATSGGTGGPTVGSVEEGGEVKYSTTEASKTQAATAPKYTVEMATEGANNLNNVVRLKFTNDSNPAAPAKFLGSINSPKINVGRSVAGDIPVTATAKSAAGTAQAIFPASGTTTYPAYVSKGSVSVRGANLVAQTVAQNVGGITVTRADGALTGNVKVNVNAGSFSTADDVKATFYDAKDAQVGSVVDATEAPGSLSVAVPAAVTTATRVEFTGATITPAAASSDPITLSLDSTDNGGAVALTGAVGSKPVQANGAAGSAGTDLNQTDIVRNDTSAVTLTPTAPVAGRLSGFDRYSTATSVAQQLGKQVDQLKEQETVVVASGENFADALSAGYLAATAQAPVVLTQKGRLPAATADYLRDFGVKNVYIVGGTGAVSSAVEDGLKARDAVDVDDADNTNNNSNAVRKSLTQKIHVVRISGADRFETNRNVNRYAYQLGGQKVGSLVPAYGQASRRTAIVVNGMTPWDALAAGPMVGGNASGAMPLILTAGDKLQGQAAGQVSDFSIENALVIGGEGVVSAGAVKDLSDRGVTATRLAGANRWATAKAVNDLLIKPAAAPTSAAAGAQGFGRGTTTADRPFLVNGGVIAGKADATKWADALGVGAVAAQSGDVLALTDSTSLPAATAEFLRSFGVETVNSSVPVGGADVVSDAVVRSANAELAK